MSNYLALRKKTRLYLQNGQGTVNIAVVADAIDTRRPTIWSDELQQQFETDKFLHHNKCAK